VESKAGIEWELFSEVYHQDEAQLISGILTMAGIPVRLEQEALGKIYALTVGPLGCIKIYIQLGRKSEAEKILAEGSTALDDFEEDK
jgi:hypothetical protein